MTDGTRGNPFGKLGHPDAPAGDDDGPLQGVLQFPDIPRPVVILQPFQRFGLDSDRFFPHVTGIAADEILRQERQGVR